MLEPIRARGGHQNRYTLRGVQRSRLELRAERGHDPRSGVSSARIEWHRRKCVVWLAPPAEGKPPLVVAEGDDTLTITVGDVSAQFTRLRSALQLDDPERIVVWQWSHHFKHLPKDEVDSLIGEWLATEWASHRHEWSLADANRSAQRALYAASRAAGWRRLSPHAQKRLGLGGVWQRDEVIAAAQARGNQ